MDLMSRVQHSLRNPAEVGPRCVGWSQKMGGRGRKGEVHYSVRAGFHESLGRVERCPVDRHGTWKFNIRKLTGSEKMLLWRKLQ